MSALFVIGYSAGISWGEVRAVYRDAWARSTALSLSCWPCDVIACTKFEAPSWPFCERHDPVTIWRGQLAGRRARIKVRP